MSRARGTIIVTGIQAPPFVPTPPEKLLSLRRYDGTALLGVAGILTTGAPTAGWNATLKRYARQGLVNASIVTERVQFFMEPRAIVDPRYPPTGLIVKLRDTLRFDITAGAPPWPANVYARASFGFRANPGALSSANNNGTPFIGFRLDLLGNTSVVNPTWKADYVNWDSSTRTSKDTGITAAPARNLVVELNGDDQRIRWYIDGLLVHTMTPAANDVGGQNLTPAEWAIDTEVNCVGVAGGPTVALNYHAGVGPLLTCYYVHDA